MQIQLERDQHRLLRRRARELGVSISEVVRRSIEADLQANKPDERQEKIRRARAVVGKYRDSLGDRDVAPRHDAVLGEVSRS